MESPPSPTSVPESHLFGNSPSPTLVQEQEHDRRKEDETLEKAKVYKKKLEDMTDEERALRKLEIEEEIDRCDRKIRGRLASKIESLRDSDHVVRLQNRKAELLIIEGIEKDNKKKARRARSKSKDQTVMDNMRKTLNRSYSREASRGRSDQDASKQGKKTLTAFLSQHSKDSSGEPICSSCCLSSTSTTYRLDILENAPNVNHTTNTRILFIGIQTRLKDSVEGNSKQGRKMWGEGNLEVGQKVPHQERNYNRLKIHKQAFKQVVKMTRLESIINERLIYCNDNGHINIMIVNTCILSNPQEGHHANVRVKQAWKVKGINYIRLSKEPRKESQKKGKNTGHQHCQVIVINHHALFNYLSAFLPSVPPSIPTNSSDYRAPPSTGLPTPPPGTSPVGGSLCPVARVQK